MRVEIITAGIAALLLLGSCTERRRATTPVPDGDTIEVVIPEGRHDTRHPVRIIETDDDDPMDVQTVSGGVEPI